MFHQQHVSNYILHAGRVELGFQPGSLWLQNTASLMVLSGHVWMDEWRSYGGCVYLTAWGAAGKVVYTFKKELGKKPYIFLSRSPPVFIYHTPCQRRDVKGNVDVSFVFSHTEATWQHRVVGTVRTGGRCVRGCGASCGPRMLPVGEETSVPPPWHKLYIQSQVSVSGRSPLPVPSYWARLGLRVPETSKMRLAGCLE